MILNDSWQTPQWLFVKLNNEFQFDIDLCTNGENSKCDMCVTQYFEFTPYEDSTCFMNPPYSNKLPFIEKAWEDSKYCKIVILVPVDTSTKWWAVFWDYENHKPKEGCEYPRFFNKRIKFDKPQGLETGSSGPTFPSCVLVFDRRNI